MLLGVKIETYDRKPPLVLCFLNTNVFKWAVFFLFFFSFRCDTFSVAPVPGDLTCIFLIQVFLSHLLSP